MLLLNVSTHRVMEEIEEVVGDKTSVEADDLDKLTYMNQVYGEYFMNHALSRVYINGEYATPI